MNGLLDQIFNPVYTYTASGGVQTRMDSSLNGNVYVGDASTNYGIYLNGAAWTASAGVANICGAVGNINLSSGTGITIAQPNAGTFVFTSTGGTNTGVTTICGATGAINLSSGTGITIAQPTVGTFVFTGTGGTGAGVSSIAVNGGAPQTGAVALSSVTGVTVNGGASQTGAVALSSVTGVTVNGGASQTGAVALSSVTGLAVNGGASQTGNVVLTSVTSATVNGTAYTPASGILALPSSVTGVKSSTGTTQTGTITFTCGDADATTIRINSETTSNIILSGLPLVRAFNYPASATTNIVVLASDLSDGWYNIEYTGTYTSTNSIDERGTATVQVNGGQFATATFQFFLIGYDPANKGFVVQASSIAYQVNPTPNTGGRYVFRIFRITNGYSG